MRRVPMQDILNGAVLCAAYFVTAKFGLMLDPVGGCATLVWPPTGLALAALLLSGLRLWPGVALAAFLANGTSGAPVPVACGIAVGNTLEAVGGAFLLRRVGMRLRPGGGSEFVITFGAR